MDTTEIDKDDYRFCDNQLLRELKCFLSSVDGYKGRARQFYFEVVLSIFRCPACGGQLQMTGTSKCSCSCGNIFDPTLSFQKSDCCGAGLSRKTFHYICSKCHKINPSRFIFDERIFDKAYFRKMMRESRDRKENKREEIRQLIALSRSEPLTLLENPQLDAIPGLIEDLDKFIQNTTYESGQFFPPSDNLFEMDKYREHILSVLTWDNMLFSEIDPLFDDIRDDKIYRFITLVFMDHDLEIELNQLGDDLSVQRRYNEAYA
jgi:hypothetical protein